MVTDVFEGKLETVGEAQAIRDGLGPVAKKSLHFGGTLEMALGIFCQERAGHVEMSVFANTGKNVKHFPA
jgi:hypothetical protein